MRSSGHLADAAGTRIVNRAHFPDSEAVLELKLISSTFWPANTDVRTGTLGRVGQLGRNADLAPGPPMRVVLQGAG